MRYVFSSLLFFSCFVHADIKAPVLDAGTNLEEYLLSEYCQQNQLYMNSCAAEVEKMGALSLEAIYGKLLIKDSTLKLAHDAWLKYRNVECKRRAKPFEGGSIYSFVYDECLKGMNKHKANIYSKELNCKRDGGCDVGY